MATCDPKGPLVIQIVKLYPTADRKAFDAFGRIFSGTVFTSQKLKVLGEGYSADDEEDMSVQIVNSLWVYETRYRINVPSLTAGNLVLIGGIDESIIKTATLIGDHVDDMCIFRPLSFPTVPVFKVSIEPLNPSELPKMLDGLRKINKSYPLAATKVCDRNYCRNFAYPYLYINRSKNQVNTR